MLLRCVNFLATAIVSVSLLSSSFIHISNPYAFFNSILGYEVVSASVATMSAAFIPFLQLIVGSMLLSGLGKSIAIKFALVLLVLFLGLQISILVRGLEIGCGCFGPMDNSIIGLRSLSQTTMLIALTGLIWLCERVESGSSDMPMAAFGS